MNQFKLGYQEAVGGVIAALIINLLVPKFIEAGLLPETYGWMIAAFNLLACIIGILAFPGATLLYFLGWIFGMYIMFQAGFLGIFDILAFFASIGLYIYVNFLSGRGGY